MNAALLAEPHCDAIDLNLGCPQGIAKRGTVCVNVIWFSIGQFTLHNFCLKLSHATCLQLELYCVNQAHNSPTTTLTSCEQDLHSTTQVVSRLHVTVLDKSCTV
jgi:hypothetical protein